MITLTPYENADLQLLLIAIAGLVSGTRFCIATLLGGRSVSPRIARRFYEEVHAGMHPNVRPLGLRSSDGYEKI